LDEVDFLKLDIEGGEFGLFSVDVSWLRKVRRVALEAHTKFGNPQSLADLLERAGFRVQFENSSGSANVMIYAAR
jgi:hypothetical protein